MRAAMVRHDVLIEAGITRHNGTIVRPRGEGDSRFAVFLRATQALAAAVAIQKTIAEEPWPLSSPLKVRIGIHTGEADLRDGDYYGSAVNRCARLRGAAHGGQTLLSMITFSLVQDNLPSGVSLLDLGEFNLRDLKRPEHIYQLVIPGLPATFPPLRAIESVPTNLPVALNRFIGREREIAELKHLLASTRLLTIKGPGGAGKTRLALQVGADLLDSFPDGVWLVDLAPLSNPALVSQATAHVFDIREEEGRPLADTLVAALRAKNLLLIYDNCEHLLLNTAQLVKELLVNIPKLKIMATSREPLGTAGEVVWSIPPLSSPSPREAKNIDKLAQYDAIQLFVDRAVAVKSDFTLSSENAPAIAEISQKLEGIPLAIELAAARIKVLSAEEIARRISACFQLLAGGDRTAAPRQQTLRALIDWSHDLLSEEEQILLRRLSVFAGGWTLPAAEKVCANEELESWEVLDLLTSLVDKSLVVAELQVEQQRYRFLEIIRQYAQERLARSNEKDELLYKHAEYFLKLARASYGELWGTKQGYWLERLEAEHDNLRTALEWLAQDANHQELLLRMASSLWRFWEIHGHLSEGRAYLEQALAANPDGPVAWRAHGLRGAGNLARQQGDYSRAKMMHEQSLALFHEMEDKLGIARELEAIGEIVWYQGDTLRAVELLTESLALRYEIDDKEGVAASLAQLGNLARDRGQYEHARELLEESLKLNRELGDKLYTASTLNNLGLVAYLLCEYAQANAFFEEALSLYRRLHDRSGIASTLQNLANVAKDQGYFKEAAKLFNDCLELLQDLGDKRGIARVLSGLAEVAFFQGDYPRARELSDQGLDLFQEQGIKRGVMAALVVRAYIAHYQGDYERAGSIAKKSLALSVELNSPRVMADAKAVLGLGAYVRGNLEEALAILHEAIAIFRKVGDNRNIAHTLVNLARTAYRLGDQARALEYLNESLSISRKVDIRWSLAFSLEILGLLHRSQGHYERARELFRESLLLSAEQENQQGIANCLGALAGLAALTERPVRAARLFAAALKLREAMSAQMASADQGEYEHYLAILRKELGDQDLKAAWLEGYTMPLEQVIAEASELVV